AEGLGAAALSPALSACGGGRAEGGRCGALHAALLLVPEEKRRELAERFRAEAGSELCREIKATGFPCVKCVEIAARLAEEALKQ
ncbi:MAG: hypothetical protein J6Q65_03980, partial [Lentisphaeria bacterium]|nr:hypothetical protein [Lentisphaeria bacterium]